jgi:hypothetical protein
MTGREKLRRLAQDIAGLIEQERLLAPGVRTISPELGLWFIRAVRSSDVSKALGIKRGKGRPRQDKKAQEESRTRRMAKAAFLIKREHPKKTFPQIASELKADDGEWLRKAHNRYEQEFKAEFMIAELTARLNRPRRKK